MTAAAAVTAISAAAAVLNSRENQELAEMTMVAEAAQRALLTPPSWLEPLELAVVYLAATAGPWLAMISKRLPARHRGSG